MDSPQDPKNIAKTRAGWFREYFAYHSKLLGLMVENSLNHPAPLKPLPPGPMNRARATSMAARDGWRCDLYMRLAAKFGRAAIAQLGERQIEDLRFPGSLPGLGSFILPSRAHAVAWDCEDMGGMLESLALHL